VARSSDVRTQILKRIERGRDVVEFVVEKVCVGVCAGPGGWPTRPGWDSQRPGWVTIRLGDGFEPVKRLAFTESNPSS
jgi:hypothetical protein